MSDNTTSGMSANSHADAEIEIVGTLQPNPIPRSLPEGSTITVRLDMTLQKSDSPLTFYTKDSFIAQNQTMLSRFRVYHPATDDGTGGWRRIHINAVPGTLVNVDEDLMTLYPDVTVSVDVTTKVYTKKADDGQERKYFFGSRFSTLETGEKYEMCLGAAIQPMLWLYWGTKEDIIEEFVKGNGHSGHTGECSRIFRTRKAYGWGEQPLLRMVRPIEFSVVE
ncbi:hypothetical protein NHQ30_001652 [Ciborinia camelliae]|nr:hypothetical protein NHQ30_001652 [Ciborinia camelliae]